ncbi:MAG: carboxypeptidase-like regulatory domain-containing protein, partial [Alistipes sp.]|nr:carboxypeptidase-like regulatory domain-containing protein [Alistipes sp.]
MNKLTHSLLLCVAVLFIGCTEDEVPIFGDVYGTISNSETGEPVRNAEVILSPNNMSTVSGSDGHFEFRQLEAKQYTISVSADGYESNSRQITIIPGQSVSCDIRLKPQAVVEIFDINPLTLNFGTTQTQMAVTVTNDSKKDAQWSLDLGQNTWLKASPIAGQISAGKSQTIVFYANRANLSEETSGIVTFSALGGSSSLTANCSPSKQVSSIMEVTPLDIDFGDQSTEQIFRIKNKSNALLNWTIFGLESDALSVSDTSGTIQAGNAKVISIKLDRSKVQANNLVTSFMVSDGTNDQQINVNVGSHESNVSNTDPDNTDQPDNQEAMGRLELPQDYIDFGLNDSVRPFTIKNVGDASVEWEITDVQDDIFTFSPDSGTLEAGNETEIQVAIDRDGLPAGADESAFAISDGVNKYIVTIQFMEPEYTDGKIKLLTSTLDFGTEAAKLDLKVENVGTTYLSWTISDIPDYITCYPTYKQGMKSIAITPIELNRATMPEAVDTFIIITNDYNPSDTHKVRITATKEG